MHFMHASVPSHGRPQFCALVLTAAAAGEMARMRHDMHVQNSLVDTRSSNPRAPAQVAAVGHERISCETCSTLSLRYKRRGKPNFFF